MATIRSLSEALGTLRDNPLIFVAGAMYAVVVLPQTALSQFGIPLVPQLLQFVTFFITPFVIAGILAMAYEGLHRETSFETFTEIGKDRYLRLLLGNLAEAVLTFVFVVVVAIAAFFTIGIGMATAMGSATDPSAALLGSIGLVTVLVVVVPLLLFMVVMFFLQFYDVAYVVDDAGVVEGFAESVSLVKNNLVPALGFGVVNLAVALALALPTVVLALVPFVVGAGTGGMGAEQARAANLGTSLLSQLAVVAYLFLVSVVMVPFRKAFAVAFYDNHS